MGASVGCPEARTKGPKFSETKADNEALMVVYRLREGTQGLPSQGGAFRTLSGLCGKRTMYGNDEGIILLMM